MLVHVEEDKYMMNMKNKNTNQSNKLKQTSTSKQTSSKHINTRNKHLCISRYTEPFSDDIILCIVVDMRTSNY